MVAQDLKGLVLTENPQTSKNTLVIHKSLQDRIDQVIHEYRQQGKLKSHGLSHRRKILLIGPPGTGKTMTARALAYELNIPLHTIQVDRLVTQFLGETSAKLRKIFNMIHEQHGIYFFDEFDSIGGERSLENDVGEMRRVLNSFLQFVEQDASDNIIVAATNNPKLLDRALFRRFDDVIFYDNPSVDERKQLVSNILGSFKDVKFDWKEVLVKSNKLSHSEIVRSCTDAVKKAILSDKNKVNSIELMAMLDNCCNGERLAA